MAKKKKSVLSGVSSKAIKKHAGDETSYGQVDLPPGIKGGVAQLKAAYFGNYKDGATYAGEPFLRMSGVVIEPKTQDGQKAAGLTTSVILPACETKKNDGTVVPQEDNIARIMNEMRKLGADTSEVESGEDLEALAEALTEATPHFQFSTTISQDKKRVWENWNGAIDDYQGGEEDDDVEEDDDDEEDTEDDDDDDDDGEEVDLAALASAADDDDDDDASEKLNELALAAGVDQETIDEADSWADVVTMIEEGDKEDDDDEEDDDEEYEPSKDDVVKYKPPRKKKPIDVTVTRINKKQQKCTVKSNSDGTLFKAIPWSDLITD